MITIDKVRAAPMITTMTTSCFGAHPWRISPLTGARPEAAYIEPGGHPCHLYLSIVDKGFLNLFAIRRASINSLIYLYLSLYKKGPCGGAERGAISELQSEA